ncbi:hypothetical protein GW17_00027774, partial [Ensete ventricosum]
ATSLRGRKIEVTSVRYDMPVPSGWRRRLIPSPHTGRHFFSPCGEKKSPMGDRSRERRAAPDSRFFSSRSSSFSLPRLIPPEISRRRSKSTITARQRPAMIEIDRYWSISGGNRAEIAPIDGTAW